MKILVLAATQQEIEPFLQSSLHIDVVIGGVGVAATTYHLTKQLVHHHYDIVIQAGVGGLFSNSDMSDWPKLTEVVCISKDAFGDLGAWENQQFKSIADLQLNNQLEWLHNKNSTLNSLPFKKVTGITINTVTDNQDKIQALRRKWDPVVESMEGAALHYVCSEKGVPFIQLRALCNYVGERDKSKWQLEESIVKLNDALVKSVSQFVLR